MKGETMSTAEVAEYAGITLRQMYHWVEKDWVCPVAHQDDDPGEGRRPNMRWTERDAALVLAHARLMEAGLTGEAAAAALEQGPRGGWLTEHVRVTVKP